MASRGGGGGCVVMFGQWDGGCGCGGCVVVSVLVKGVWGIGCSGGGGMYR